VILFFGYVRKYKGLHVLLDAMPKVLQETNVRLLVAGEFYDDEQGYRDQIQRLGIGNSVSIFADYIPNEEVGLYYSAADVVVLPYISATQSGIIQIAYNYDKPVITTNVGGLPEVVDEGKTGFIVPSEDVDALATSIVSFFKIKDKIDFSKNISEYKKQFSWDRMAAEIEAFIKA
jgi:glycosyltransferase involved in cell wall biosynthesis